MGPRKPASAPVDSNTTLAWRSWGRWVMITVDGDGTVADGRKSGLCLRLCEIAGRPIVTAAAGWLGGLALSKAPRDFMSRPPREARAYVLTLLVQMLPLRAVHV